jgi:hypothetical protein
LTWIDPWGWSCTPNKINLTKAGVKHVKNRHVGNKIGWEHKSKWTLNNAEIVNTPNLVQDSSRKLCCLF